LTYFNLLELLPNLSEFEAKPTDLPESDPKLDLLDYNVKVGVLVP
jgi:hypothetical protein